MSETETETPDLKSMLPSKKESSSFLQSQLADDRVIAQMFLESGYFTVRSLPQAMTKIVIGREMGLSASTSIQGLFIIEGTGKIGCETWLMRHMVDQDKRGFTWKEVEHTHGKSYTLEFFRKDESLGLRTWTIEDAARNGLLGKNNWKANPDNMLYWRCLSRGLRELCGFTFGAMQVYTREEIEDGDTDDLETPAAPAEGSLADIASKVKAKVKPEAAAPVEEPIEAEVREIEEEAPPAVVQKPKAEKAATSPVKAPVAPEPVAEPVDPLADDEPQAEGQEQASIVSSDDPNRLVMSDGTVLDSLRTTMEFFKLDATHELYFQRLKPPSLRMVADLMDEIAMSKIKATDAISQARTAKIATWGQFVDLTIDLIRKADEAPEPAATPERDMSVDYALIRESLEPIFREEGMEPTACEWLIEQEAIPGQLAAYIAHLRSQGVDATGRILLHAEAGSTLADAFEADAFEAVQ